MPAAHRFPHTPQLLASDDTSTHPEAHSVKLPLQVQLPPTHVAPVGQTRSHAPQWSSSASSCLHVPEQIVPPPGQ